MCPHTHPSTLLGTVLSEAATPPAARVLTLHAQRNFSLPPLAPSPQGCSPHSRALDAQISPCQLCEASAGGPPHPCPLQACPRCPSHVLSGPPASERCIPPPPQVPRTQAWGSSATFTCPQQLQGTPQPPTLCRHQLVTRFPSQLPTPISLPAGTPRWGPRKPRALRTKPIPSWVLRDDYLTCSCPTQS